ncbi:hypothetical protein MJM83_26405, partial [Salmonella enterica subsp. enterica serovar Montevideo]|nr:hypothetical protein [Salmonella enterica subsp. enterica serovar Montevideo]
MTDTIKIYHNPRCSKSRDTLNLLKSNGVEPEVVLYLDTPADAVSAECNVGVRRKIRGHAPGTILSFSGASTPFAETTVFLR